MSVDAPGREDAFGETIFAGATDVIHDFFVPVFDDRLPDAGRDVIKRLVPTHLLPTSSTTAPGALHWMKNAIWIMNLIQRRRALCAVSSARARMFWIAFELLNLAGSFVDISE